MLSIGGRILCECPLSLGRQLSFALAANVGFRRHCGAILKQIVAPTIIEHHACS